MRFWFGRRVCEFAIYLIAMPCIVCGQITSNGPAGQQVIQEGSASPALAAHILNNETAVWEAAKKRDMHAFAELVADDARMVFTSGVMTKQDYMAEVAKRVITQYSLQNFQAFMPMKGTVITLYQATVSGSSGGKTFPPTTVRESSVWIKRGGKWVAVWNQETPTK
jgi:hypothetical protein